MPSMPDQTAYRMSWSSAPSMLACLTRDKFLHGSCDRSVFGVNHMTSHRVTEGFIRQVPTHAGHAPVTAGRLEEIR